MIWKAMRAIPTPAGGHVKLARSGRATAQKEFLSGTQNQRFCPLIPKDLAGGEKTPFLAGESSRSEGGQNGPGHSRGDHARLGSPECPQVAPIANPACSQGGER